MPIASKFAVFKKWRLLLKTSEGMIFFFGCLIFLGIGIGILALLFINPVKAHLFSSVLGCHLLGGRAASIFICLHAELSTEITIFYNMLIEVAVVCFTYPLFVFVVRDVIKVKIFHTAVKKAEKAAQNHKSLIKKYGVFGLFVFVLFPFQMTGPVIGAFLGYLMNYKTILTFSLVLTGTFLSVLLYTLMGEPLVLQLKDSFSMPPYLMPLIICIFILWHVTQFSKWLNLNITKDSEK